MYNPSFDWGIQLTTDGERISLLILNFTQFYFMILLYKLDNRVAGLALLLGQLGNCPKSPRRTRPSNFNQ